MYTSFLINVSLCFTCGERKICSTIKNVSKYYEHDKYGSRLIKFVSKMLEKQLRSVIAKIGIFNQFSNNVQVKFGETR